jgi:type II secretory pathway component PulK
LLWLIRGPHEGWAIIHAVAAVLTVLTTIAGAVPTHQLLSRSNENHDIHRLQRWHALRTLAWAVCVVASIYGR